MTNAIPRHGLYAALDEAHAEIERLAPYKPPLSLDMSPIIMLCGDIMIEDMMNPRAEEIDLEHIEVALRQTYRYSARKDSLTVHQHRVLVRLLAEWDDADPMVVDWAYHHDDHEAFVGDLASPFKTLLRRHTKVYDTLVDRFDTAICMRRGTWPPSQSTREAVDVYDKASAVIEFMVGFGMPFDDRWCHPWAKTIPDAVAVQLFNIAKSAR